MKPHRDMAGARGDAEAMLVKVHDQAVVAASLNLRTYQVTPPHSGLKAASCSWCFAKLFRLLMEKCSSCSIILSSSGAIVNILLTATNYPGTSCRKESANLTLASVSTLKGSPDMARESALLVPGPCHKDFTMSYPATTHLHECHLCPRCFTLLKSLRHEKLDNSSFGEG